MPTTPNKNYIELVIHHNDSTPNKPHYMARVTFTVAPEKENNSTELYLSDVLRHIYKFLRKQSEDIHTRVQTVDSLRSKTESGLILPN